MIKKDDFMINVFAYIESINITKENIMYGEAEEKFYTKARFVILRALSFSPDLVSIVNLANMRDMGPRMEYEFFLNFIPKKHRRNKWHKKTPNSLFTNSVREYYGYNEAKAVEAMKLLTVEQMTMIDKKNKKEDSWTFSEDGASKSS